MQMFVQLLLLLFGAIIGLFKPKKRLTNDEKFASIQKQGEILMAKTTTESSTTKPRVLNDSAFGIARDSKGQYFLVSLKYNIDTKECEIVEALEQPNRGEAFERFKIKVASSDIMGG